MNCFSGIRQKVSGIRTNCIMKSQYHFKVVDLNVYQKAMDYGAIVNEQVKIYPKAER